MACLDVHLGPLLSGDMRALVPVSLLILQNTAFCSIRPLSFHARYFLVQEMRIVLSKTTKSRYHKNVDAGPRIRLRVVVKTSLTRDFWLCKLK